ncbi:hypothetical protein [Streptomyces sp. NPDC088350]|uniref:hypothetical protein n=1 Tax=Streptomyces sp. NPDC088350 TaxID=3365854 RepID=UPI0037F48A3A
MRGVADRQAAVAVRSRLDRKYRKYCLGFGPPGPGFDFSELSEFHARVTYDDQAVRLPAFDG